MLYYIGMDWREVEVEIERPCRNDCRVQVNYGGGRVMVEKKTYTSEL